MNRRMFPLGRDQRGITVVEFAMVAPVMMIMMMGFFDLAHREFARVILQGAVTKAARDSSLELGPTNTAAIDAKVVSSVREVIGVSATFTPTRLTYSNFSEVGQPERYVDGTPANSRYDLGECFDDVNGNGVWDSDLGRNGQGGARDAVLYRMTVTYPRLFPMAGLVGLSPTVSIDASTVMRNQPYGDQALPTFAVCP